MKPDLTEELCILAVTCIAMAAIFVLEKSSAQIVSAAIGGLVGYLTRGVIKK